MNRVRICSYWARKSQQRRVMWPLREGREIWGVDGAFAIMSWQIILAFITHSAPGAHAFRSRARSVLGADRVRSRACSVPGADRVRSRARYVPGAHTVHSRARSVPGAHAVRSRARSVPGAHTVHSRARSVPGAHSVRSRARSVPGAHAVRSGPRPRSGLGTHRARWANPHLGTPVCPLLQALFHSTGLAHLPPRHFLFSLCGASGIHSLKGGLCHGPADVPRLATRCLCVLSTWLVVCLVPCAPMSIVCPLPSCYLIIVSVAPAVSPSLPSFVSLYSLLVSAVLCWSVVFRVSFTEWDVDCVPVFCLPACLPACLFFPFRVVYVLLFDLVIKTLISSAFESMTSSLLTNITLHLNSLLVLRWWLKKIYLFFLLYIIIS